MNILSRLALFGQLMIYLPINLRGGPGLQRGSTFVALNALSRAELSCDMRYQQSCNALLYCVDHEFDRGPTHNQL